MAVVFYRTTRCLKIHQRDFRLVSTKTDLCADPGIADTAPKRTSNPWYRKVALASSGHNSGGAPCRGKEHRYHGSWRAGVPSNRRGSQSVGSQSVCPSRSSRPQYLSISVPLDLRKRIYFNMALKLTITMIHNSPLD